jgi:chromatin segregation and condensation protein Rec8/ScpA/Scc1 (kleisin family)
MIQIHKREPEIERNRGSETRHLLPPPHFTQLHAEIGGLFTELAATNDKLDEARRQLLALMDRCGETMEECRQLETGLQSPSEIAKEAVSTDSMRERIRILQLERSNTLANASLQRLQTARLERAVERIMERITELSEIERMMPQN